MNLAEKAWYALWWKREHRLDQPMEYMSKRKAMEKNAAIARAGVTHVRWRQTDLHTSDLQFCMDCGGEWTDDNPCVC